MNLITKVLTTKDRLKLSISEVIRFVVRSNNTKKYVSARCWLSVLQNIVKQFLFLYYKKES